MTVEAELVSVVITNYNYAGFVATAVDSALNQGEMVEIIVVDDGSTDDSLAVLDRFGDDISVISKPNGGQGSAFNAGIAAATGPLVMLLDADDRMLPGAVDRLRRAAAANPDAIMFLHPLVVIDGEGKPTGATLPESNRTLPSGNMRSQVMSTPDDVSWQPTSGLAFRSECLRPVLPIPEEPFALCADVYLVNTVPLYGPIAALTEPGAEYRDHGANAHLRSGFDLDRARATLRRSEVTQEEIRRRAVELGLSPEGVHLTLGSVTNRATALIVSRLDQEGPTAVLSHIAGGIEAARHRPDIGPARKLMMVGWFIVTAIAPRATLRPLAELALTR